MLEVWTKETWKENWTILLPMPITNITQWILFDRCWTQFQHTIWKKMNAFWISLFTTLESSFPSAVSNNGTSVVSLWCSNTFIHLFTDTCFPVFVSPVCQPFCFIAMAMNFCAKIRICVHYPFLQPNKIACPSIQRLDLWLKYLKCSKVHQSRFLLMKILLFFTSHNPLSLGCSEIPC